MSGKKKGGGGGGHGGAPWVITFADLMSLLMALFVMIVSFSSQDEQKLHEAAGSMRDAFGYQSVQRPAGMIEQNGGTVFGKKERRAFKTAYKKEIVKRSAVLRIVAAWIITVPATALLAAILFQIVSTVLG